MQRSSTHAFTACINMQTIHRKMHKNTAGWTTSTHAASTDKLAKSAAAAQLQLLKRILARLSSDFTWRDWTFLCHQSERGRTSATCMSQSRRSNKPHPELTSHNWSHTSGRSRRRPGSNRWVRAVHRDNTWKHVSLRLFISRVAAKTFRDCLMYCWWKSCLWC